jgi:hypothetical protein
MTTFHVVIKAVGKPDYEMTVEADRKEKATTLAMMTYPHALRGELVEYVVNSLELKSISVNQRLSEETYCYSARLFWNGKHVADVGNRGHGGPDEAHVVKGQEAAFAEAEAFVKSLPPIPSEYSKDGLAMDLDLWCGVTLDEYMKEREVKLALRRDLKKSVVFIRDGELFNMTFKDKAPISKKHIDYVKTKHPSAKIVNELPGAEALSIYRALVFHEGAAQ